MNFPFKVTFGYIGESPENFKIYTGSILSILRINIVFFGPNMAASQLTWNEKVLEAQILSGLYWDYICSIGNVNWHIQNLAKRWLCAFNMKNIKKNKLR